MQLLKYPTTTIKIPSLPQRAHLKKKKKLNSKNRQQFKKNKRTNTQHAGQTSAGPEARVRRRLGESDRRKLSRVGIRWLDVRWRRWLVEVWRQTEAVIDLDLEGHAALALSTVVGVGEVVVGTRDCQRHRHGQRFLELVLAAVVLVRITVLRFVHGAVPVYGFVVGLDHRRVRNRNENYRN